MVRILAAQPWALVAVVKVLLRGLGSGRGPRLMGRFDEKKYHITEVSIGRRGWASLTGVRNQGFSGLTVGPDRLRLTRLGVLHADVEVRALTKRRGGGGSLSALEGR